MFDLNIILIWIMFGSCFIQYENPASLGIPILKMN